MFPGCTAAEAAPALSHGLVNAAARDHVEGRVAAQTILALAGRHPGALAAPAALDGRAHRRRVHHDQATQAGP